MCGYPEVVVQGRLCSMLVRFLEFLLPPLICCLLTNLIISSRGAYRGRNLMTSDHRSSPPWFYSLVALLQVWNRNWAWHWIKFGIVLSFKNSPSDSFRSQLKFGFLNSEVPLSPKSKSKTQQLGIRMPPRACVAKFSILNSSGAFPACCVSWMLWGNNAS